MSGAFECMGLSSREALFQVLSIQDGLFREVGGQEELFPGTPLPRLSDLLRHLWQSTEVALTSTFSTISEHSLQAIF
jgi:hypothetical protein